MNQLFPILFHLAECQYKNKQYDDAIKSLLKLQKIYSNNMGYRPLYYPKSFYLLGKIYEAKGDTSKAIKNYEKLLDIWKNADKDLVDLIDTKIRLMDLKKVA
jgi:tetratricopeptide (TPR) repeat protein